MTEKKDRDSKKKKKKRKKSLGLVILRGLGQTQDNEYGCFFRNVVELECFFIHELSGSVYQSHLGRWHAFSHFYPLFDLHDCRRRLYVVLNRPAVQKASPKDHSLSSSFSHFPCLLCLVCDESGVGECPFFFFFFHQQTKDNNKDNNDDDRPH